MWYTLCKKIIAFPKYSFSVLYAKIGAVLDQGIEYFFVIDWYVGIHTYVIDAIDAKNVDENVVN
jgi:hypothetical protein